MVANAVLWAALSAPDKAAWNYFALHPNENDYDPWGSLRYLSGFQWFARAQVRRSSVSLANPGPVPSGSAQTVITGLVITVQHGLGGTSWLTYDDNQFTAGQAIIPYLSLAPTPGAADSFRNWKMILPTISPPNAGFDIHAAWRAAFGDVPAGWQAYCLAYKQAPAGNRSIGASANCPIT